MSQRIRIGVVGLGEIAQLMHLPFLAINPDYEIAAVCDISSELVERIGATYSVPTRVTDYHALLDQVDAVAILTMEHADIFEAAASQGKHIFVEKPLSFSPEGCARIVAAAERAGTTVMVGYMRRYDPAYVQACASLPDDGVALVRVHDFGGSFTVHPALYGLRYPTDIGEHVREELQDRVEMEMRAALAPTHEHLTAPYFDLLMSGIHDLSMLRGMFGQAQEVVSAASLGSAGTISVLKYPDDVTVVFEMRTTSSHAWWDQNLAVYANDRTVTLDFPSPFIRNAPTVLTVHAEGSPHTTTGQVSYDSPFRLEWEHFAECVRGRMDPLTTAADAASDVALAAAMVNALPAAERA